MRKIISICLAVACLLLSVNVILAEENENISDSQREAISLLNDLNIFSGIGEDDAANTITRGEFACIVVKVVGGENLSASPRRIYTDVLPDNAAAASIEYLYDRGIMIGYDSAEFRPNEVIPVEEAVKVMVSVMGYSNWAEQKGGYPDGYYAIAMSNNLLNGVSSGRKEKVTVADAAVIIQNVLENKNYLVINGYIDGYPVEEKVSDKDYMGYALDIYKYTGIVEAYGDTALSDASSGYKADTCKIGGELFDKGDMDFSQYLGMKVRAYYKSDDDGYHILHIAVDKDNRIEEISSDDILENTTKSIFQYDDGGRTKRLNISDSAVFIYNGKRLDVVSDYDVISDNGFVRLISNDGDNKYDVVLIKEYETYVVDKSVATDKILNFKYGKGSLNLQEGEGIKAKYYIDGGETEFSSITSGSVVSVALSRNLTGEMLAEVYISNNKVTGKAVMLDTEGKKRRVVLEDESQYYLTSDYIRRIDEGEQDTYAPLLDNEGTFYIDYFNKLAAYTILSTGKNYGYVVKCYYEENEDAGAIRLFTKDGEFINLNFSENVTINGTKVKKEDIPSILARTGEENTIYQLVIYKSNENGEVVDLKLAENKTGEIYYIASDDEFILNEAVSGNIRFYKNMAEKYPYGYIDGKTLQFMIPTDKKNERDYKVVTKIASTDESLPGPIRIYDAGAAGSIGAMTTNTSSAGSYSTPVIIDSLSTVLDDDGDVCTSLNFVGGSSVLVGDYIQYDQPTTNWKNRIDYSDVTIYDLRRGDVIEYTTSNNKVDKLRVIVKVDNIGPVRIDGDDLQRNGNTVADVISMSENGRTALVYYVDRDGTERYQTVLINGTVYRYNSSDGQVYNSSTADITPGDRVLINAFWWSPQVVVIFR